MKSAQVTSICGAEVQKTHAPEVKEQDAQVTVVPVADVEDPKIIKVAKLALILADKNTDQATKHSCIMVGVRLGFLTEQEAAQLQMYTGTLEQFEAELIEATKEEE